MIDLKKIWTLSENLSSFIDCIDFVRLDLVEGAVFVAQKTDTMI